MEKIEPIAPGHRAGYQEERNPIMKHVSLIALLLAAALTGCAAPPIEATEEIAEEAPAPSEAPTEAPTEEPTTPPAPTENLDTCVETYTEGVNYFPEQLTVTHADGFSVEYHDSYKVLTLNQPWPGADPVTYVLTQCGTPVPDMDADAVIKVPVSNMVAMSTTYLPMMEAIGVLDTLVGVDDLGYPTNPAVRARIDAGEIAEIAPGAVVNVETALNLDPDLIMAFSSGFPEYDAHPALIEAGLPVVLNADWVEGTPLGRAEWVDFIALFYNREAEAEATFAEIEARYNEIRTLAQGAETAPTVFTSLPYQGTWYMPGGDSYKAILIADAGGAYIYADDDQAGSLFLDMETVYNDAADADTWIDVTYVSTIPDLIGADERYADFNAVQQGNVYNYDARLTDYGNEYFETTAARPDLVLADLLAIFHPELMPDHELYYYVRLNGAE